MFTQPGAPEAGVQVPAGTIRDGESPYDAVLREVREETGRDSYAVRRYLGAVGGRHYFDVAATGPLPERWRAYERHDGLREPTALDLFWLPLAEAGVLAGRQGERIAAMGRTAPFADVFVEPLEDPRYAVPDAGPERDLLYGFLRWQRETLVLKCEGLTPDQLASRPIAMTSMSLLGLVRHMADVERSWFRRRLAGEDAPRRFSSEDDPDGAWDDAAPSGVAEAWAAWEEEVAWADRFFSDNDLDLVGREAGVSLRWVMLHMVEEYARHMGHADLLRQAIDGRVGQ